MTEENMHLQLNNVINELSNHIESAPDRIRAYYSNEHSHPDNYPELNTDPAQQMVEDAADLVKYEFQLWDQREAIVIDGDWAWSRSYYTHLAVSFELLLNAHFMQRKPLEYAGKLEKKATPSLTKARDNFLGQIDIDLSSKQRKRISTVIQLLKLKRNNAVHAGIHKQDHIGVKAPVYEVLQFLFSYISETNLEIVDKLGDRASSLRGHGHGLTTEKIEFPIVS